MTPLTHVRGNSQRCQRGWLRRGMASAQRRDAAGLAFGQPLNLLPDEELHKQERNHE